MPKPSVCLLGGTGFVGRRIASMLVARGHRVVVLSGHRERNRDLLVLPTLNMYQADVSDPGELRTHFRGIDVVINLVGILNEHRDGDFQRVHVDLPTQVTAACNDTGVRRLLHMSALKASPEGPSTYLRTKAEGEAAVFAKAGQSLEVTAFRPSVIFGPGDGFINLFASLLKRVPLVFPLARADARFQPVYVGDVAEVFIRSMQDHRTHGQVYELGGPRQYRLQEVVEYICAELGIRRRIWRLSDRLGWLQARVMEFAPGTPFSRDNYLSLTVDSVCDGPFPGVFGVTPRAMEEIVPDYLRPRQDPLDQYRREVRH